MKFLVSWSAALLIASVAADDEAGVIVGVPEQQWGSPVAYVLPASELEKNTQTADTAQVRSPVDPNQTWESKIQTNYDIDTDVGLKETKLNLYLTQTET